MTDDTQTDSGLCTLSTDPRADLKARGHAFTADQAQYLGHHIRNNAQLLCVGKARIRDAAEGAVERFVTLARAIEDSARTPDGAPAESAAWDAALAIAGKWVDLVIVQPRTRYLFARSTTGKSHAPDCARPQTTVEIRVQLLNDKPHQTHILGPYSSTTLDSAIAHLDGLMPDDFEKWWSEREKERADREARSKANGAA